MPRDGSGVYHRPVGTDAVTDTSIESTKYNINVADVEQDLNTPRPIVAGGTGSSSADAALLALSAEKAKQVVTNFDTMVWVPGSFYSATTATSPPVAAHAFAGIAYYANASDFVVEALDLTDPNHPRYSRVMSGGVWGAWTLNNVASFVLKAGDTMTGPLVLPGNPTTNLQAATKQYVDAADAVNAANDTAQDTAIAAKVAKAGDTMTGLLTLSADPSTNLQAATKQYVDNHAPLTGSVRYDASQSLTAAQQNQAQKNIGLPGALRSYIAGLILSTAGASTTFSVAPGVAVHNASGDVLTLAASLSKTTGAWAVGSAVGGLDTGSIANSTWYYVWLIKRPDTGVVDVCVSTSAVAPTVGGNIPSAYTEARRIGAMKTNASGQWTKFRQTGDTFIWAIPTNDVNNVNPGTGGNSYFINIPPAITVEAEASFFFSNSAANQTLYVEGHMTDGAATGVTAGYTHITEVAGGAVIARLQIWCDNGTVHLQCGVSTANSAYITTFGWRDPRGSDD